MTSFQEDSATTYHRMQIETASKQKLICMLHEQCTFHLRHAAHDTSAERRQLLDKAQNILALLQRSVILTDATAQGLFYLYDYCYGLLDRGEPDDIVNAERIMTQLHNTLSMLQKRHR